MESYQRLIDVIAIENFQMQAEYWLLTRVFVWSSLAQAAFVIGAFVFAWILARPLRAALLRRTMRPAIRMPVMGLVLKATISLAVPMIALVVLLLALPIWSGFGLPAGLIAICANLLGAWVPIRLVSRFIRNDFFSKLFAFLVFLVAALNIFEMLGPAIVWLDHMGIRLGNTRLTLLDILRGGVQLAVLLWVALAVSRLVETRVERASG